MSTTIELITLAKGQPYGYLAAFALAPKNGSDAWTAASVAAAVATIRSDTLAPMSTASTSTGEIWVLGPDGAWGKWADANA